MAQKQIDFVDRAHKKVDVMVNNQMGTQNSYIDKQLKLAQTEDFLPSQNPDDPGLGYYFPNLPESQDAVGLELGLYNPVPATTNPPAPPMTKEDFAILSTTLDGIVNRINVLSNEIGNHTSVLLNKLSELAGETARQQRKPTNSPCYTCGETGHWAPDCPKKVKKTKEKDPCYKCGQLGHWASDCLQDDIPPVPGSKPTLKREWNFLESSNPEPPTGEPPKKKRKLSKKKE